MTINERHRKLKRHRKRRDKVRKERLKQALKAKGARA